MGLWSSGMTRHSHCRSGSPILPRSTDMYFLLLIALIIMLVSFAYGGFLAAPWVPTRASDVKRFLKHAGDIRGKKMYDLGCGDGRIVCAAARAGADAEGYEISIFPYILARIRSLFGYGKVKMRFRNFWGKDFSDADVVYFFLMPKAALRLRSKFERELRPGTLILSYAFTMPGWTPAVVDVVEGRPKLYIYRVP